MRRFAAAAADVVVVDVGDFLPTTRMEVSPFIVWFLLSNDDDDVVVVVEGVEAEKSKRKKSSI